MRDNYFIINVCEMCKEGKVRVAYHNYHIQQKVRLVLCYRKMKNFLRWICL